MKRKYKLWLVIVIISSSLLVTNFLTFAVFKQVVIDNRKHEVEVVLELAVSGSQVFIDRFNEGKLTRSEAETALVSFLSKLKADQHYIWVNDDNAIARVHIRPEIVGTFQESYLRHINKLQNKNIDFEFNKNVKPVSDQIELKLNGFTKIPQWNWVVGFGVYQDDINRLFWTRASVLIIVNLACLIFIIALYYLSYRSESCAQQRNVPE